MCRYEYSRSIEDISPMYQNENWSSKIRIYIGQQIYQWKQSEMIQWHAGVTLVPFHSIFIIVDRIVFYFFFIFINTFLIYTGFCGTVSTSWTLYNRLMQIEL